MHKLRNGDDALEVVERGLAYGYEESALTGIIDAESPAATAQAVIVLIGSTRAPRGEGEGTELVLLLSVRCAEILHDALGQHLSHLPAIDAYNRRG